VEDFEGSGLQQDRWATCYYFRSSGCTNEYNGELQAYQDHNVTVADGKLSLTARREAAPGFLQDGTRRQFQYTSGMVSSHGHMSFQYGYVEFRAKLPKGRGLWPALWLLPEGRGWPPEIDVMEYIGSQPDRVYMTNHPGDGSAATSFAYVGPDFSQDWHTFALDWRPEGLTFYVDGVQRGATSTGVPHVPMYLVMNVAVGGSWPGNPDDSTQFPATMEVDYVRVDDHRPDAQS